MAWNLTFERVQIHRIQLLGTLQMDFRGFRLVKSHQNLTHDVNVLTVHQVKGHGHWPQAECISPNRGTGLPGTDPQQLPVTAGWARGKAEGAATGKTGLGGSCQQVGREMALGFYHPVKHARLQHVGCSESIRGGIHCLKLRGWPGGWWPIWEYQKSIRFLRLIQKGLTKLLLADFKISIEHAMTEMDREGADQTNFGWFKCIRRELQRNG